MFSSCSRGYSDEVLRAALGAKALEVFHRYEATKVALEALPGARAVSCPTPDCTTVLLWSPEADKNKLLFECRPCQRKWCVKCRQTYHGTALDCADFKDMQTHDTANSDSHVQEVQCPHCDTGIFRDTGCNKIKCPVCRTCFCYTCLMILPANSLHKIGQHFKSEFGGCKLYTT